MSKASFRVSIKYDYVKNTNFDKNHWQLTRITAQKLEMDHYSLLWQSNIYLSFHFKKYTNIIFKVHNFYGYFNFYCNNYTYTYQ